MKTQNLILLGLGAFFLLRKTGGLNGINGNLPSVYVMFKNPEYNYFTSMGSNVTKEMAEKYFIGNSFNVGTYPNEQFETVIGIKYSK